MGHGIVPPDAGWGTFLWLISVFVVVTVAFALSLQVIIGKLRRAVKAVDRFFVAESTAVMDVQLMKGSISPIQTLKAAFGIKRRREEVEPHAKDEEIGP